MAKKKIYKHHQRASFTDAQSDAQSREIVLGGTLRKVGAKFADGNFADLTTSIDVNSFGSLSQAIIDIGASNVCLVVSTTQTVSSALGFNSNTVVDARPNAFSIASGQSLDFENVVVKAGLYRIFSGAGTVTGRMKVTEIYPEWWGAVGDGITNDTAAIQACLDYIEAEYDLGDHGAPDVRFTRVYLCDSGLVIPNRVNLVGNYAHSAGNLNRNTGRLKFTNLSTNTKAVTIGEDVTIKRMVISGPGEGVSGTYGIYGGVDDSEALGVNTKIVESRIEDFETGIVLSRWLNLIEKCDIDDCIYGIHLTDAANHTVITKNVIEPGSASPKEGIRISYGSDRGPDGIFIHDNDIEAVYYGIVAQAGSGIVISSNRFEIINKAAVRVQGRNNASDANLTVNIHDNYIYGVAGSASSNGIYGILIEAGYTQIYGNEIRKYDSGAGTGFQYGINFGASGVIYNCLIGKNKIDAYQPFANINDLATREKIHSQFSRRIEFFWDLAEHAGDNVEHYFTFTDPVGYSSRVLLREFRTYVLEALNASITEIDIGYRAGAGNSLLAYMDNFTTSANTINTQDYATDSHFTTAGKTFIEPLSNRVYLMRMEPGSATDGQILVSLTVDEFLY